MDYPALSDSQLMDAYYECDEDAFNELMKRWRPLLERHFRRLGWPQEDAEEMTDDVFMKIYSTKAKDTGRYDVNRPFPPWLYTIASRVAVDRARQGQRRLHPTSLQIDVEGKSPKKAAGAVESDLAECLEALDERERAFIIQWENGLGELSQSEIAKQLGISPATMNRIKDKALQKLRECLEATGYGNGAG